MSMKKSITESMKKSTTKEYILPDTQNKVILHGSPNFLKDIQTILDIMVHSPTALKLLNFNANLPTPLHVEEFKEALDSGRNTGHSIQLTYEQSKHGDSASNYRWLTLLPHEIRHSYNTPIKNSNILHSLAYAIVNEADAQAIEGLIALELNEYLENNKENLPNADSMLEYFSTDPKFQFFKNAYNEAKGTNLERKAQAMIAFVKEFAQHPTKDGKSTFAELSYKTALERDTTANGGWETCSAEELKKIEDCLLGKINPETVVYEPWMKGRKQLLDEKKTIQKEWPTFCKRIMDGTFNTDVILYGQDIRPTNLIETISPQLAHHFREIGVIPPISHSIQQNFDKLK